LYTARSYQLLDFKKETVVAVAKIIFPDMNSPANLLPSHLQWPQLVNTGMYDFGPATIMATPIFNPMIPLLLTDGSNVLLGYYGYSAACMMNNIGLSSPYGNFF